MNTPTQDIAISGKSLIAGEWIAGQAETFESFNPATGERIGSLGGCGREEADRAMTAAAQAYRTYRERTPEQIGRFLRAVADQIEALGEALLETGHAESGLGMKRMTGERARTCGQIRAFAELVEKGQWLDARIDTGETDLRRVRRPLGPVVVFGASNFPFAFGTVGGDTASALTAGNPVVVKGHPSHPAVNELFAVAVQRAIETTDMPAGVFSMLQGADKDLSRALVEHPAAEAVGFTGSQRVGRILHDIAAARPRPIPVYAEMGSINPLFVLPGAMAARHDSIATALAGSITLGTGQFCTQPGVIVTVADAPQARFVDELRQALAEAPVGVLLNTAITDALADAVGRVAARDDVACLIGGSPREGESNRFQNTLLKTSARAFIADPALQAELFGPVAMIVECDDTGQMQRVAAALDGQLTATLHGDEADLALAGELTAMLEDKAGRLICNGVPTGVAVCPSMQHGGPYPASTAAATTSVGAAAIERFARFVCYQDYPKDLLPEALEDDNPRRIFRLVNGELTDAPIQSPS